MAELDLARSVVAKEENDWVRSADSVTQAQFKAAEEERNVAAVAEAQQPERDGLAARRARARGGARCGPAGTGGERVADRPIASRPATSAFAKPDRGRSSSHCSAAPAAPAIPRFPSTDAVRSERARCSTPARSAARSCTRPRARGRPSDPLPALGCRGDRLPGTDLPLGRRSPARCGRRGGARGAAASPTGARGAAGSARPGQCRRRPQVSPAQPRRSLRPAPPRRDGGGGRRRSPPRFALAATIMVHGDYDVDGQCATAVLTRALRAAGADVVPFVPHRLRDGYDFGPAGLAAARRGGRVAGDHLRLRDHRGGHGARRALGRHRRRGHRPPPPGRRDAPGHRDRQPAASRRYLRAQPSLRRRHRLQAGAGAGPRSRPAGQPSLLPARHGGAGHRGRRRTAPGREPDPGEARPPPARREQLAGAPRAGRGLRARRQGDPRGPSAASSSALA